jgi:hypothetical protein
MITNAQTVGLYVLRNIGSVRHIVDFIEQLLIEGM